MAQVARARCPVRSPGEDVTVAEYLPLVRQVVQPMLGALPASVEFDEVASWGADGLLDAVRRYEDGQAASFRTYARIRIRGAILDQMRALDWVSRTGRDRAHRIADGRHGLEQHLGRAATQEELAAALGVGLDDFHHWLGELGDLTLVSLDEIAREGRWGASSPPDDDPSAVLCERQRTRAIAAAIARLPGKEREVVPLYYAGDLTMKEIGHRLGVTESRVCQLHGQAIGRLREMLRAFGGEELRPA